MYVVWFLPLPYFHLQYSTPCSLRQSASYRIGAATFMRILPCTSYPAQQNYLSTSMSRLTLGSLTCLFPINLYQLQITIDQFVIMGNSSNKDQQTNHKYQAEMTTVNTETYINQEENEPQLCCGYEIYKKRTKQIWKIRFQQNIEEIRPYNSWSGNILDVYRNTASLERTVYLKEIHELKYSFIRAKQVPPSVIAQKQKGGINITEMVENTVLFPSEIFKTMIQKNESLVEAPKRKTFLARKSILIKDESFQLQTKRVKGLPRVSFVDQSLNNLLTDKKGNISQEAKEELMFCIKIFQLIEKHCEQKNNFLCAIKQAFVEYLIKTYTGDNKQDDRLTKDIIQFIHLYKETIETYYKLEILQELFVNDHLFSEQNLLNVATSIIFKDIRVYDIVYLIYSNKEERDEVEFQAMIRSKKDVQPEDFQIKEQFCLNKKTVDSYVEKMSIQSGIENMEVSAVIEGKPYQICVKTLKQIQKAKTPIAKLKVIVSCAEKISPTINSFYKINNLEVKRAVIDADQILSIFQYITICAKISNICTHLKIIQNFANKNQLKSMTGYYYNVVLSSVECLKRNEREASFMTARFQ